MDMKRYSDLSEMSECSDEIKIQLEHELFQDAEQSRLREEEAFDAWIESQGELYISDDKEAPDESEIDMLTEEIDF